MDGVIEQLLHRRGAGTNGRLLHLVVLGAGGSAQQVAQAMRQAHPQGFRLDDKAQYALDFRIIDGDVGLPHNSFRTEPLPHGCLCVYTSQPELEYIRESLEKTLLANLEQEDRLPFHGLPLVMVFAGQGDFMREEGINRAKSLQCPFVDVGGGLDPVRLEQALCALVESIERRAGRLHIYQALPAAGPAADAVHAVRGPVGARAGAGLVLVFVWTNKLVGEGCDKCVVPPNPDIRWSLGSVAPRGSVGNIVGGRGINTGEHGCSRSVTVTSSTLHVVSRLEGTPTLPGSRTRGEIVTETCVVLGYVTILSNNEYFRSSGETFY
ncbi:hypothetical protein HPB48_000494 [Haemaphysalis longicornis]|uniref:PG1 pseudoGTPase domain-containing protein n=1 Tax=Haemaphysalis longicornis TaxID=44386 RepID=A0A9J6FUC9_HAELO|nr:hypothetical protein HPB48_000494 [Haemaphysalis longicornis]